MSLPSDAVTAAARALGRVLRSGAYSNVIAARAAAGAADPARVRALIFGTLRRLRSIDRAIESAASRRISRIDPPVLDIIRVSVSDLGSQRPPAVVVDTAVEAVRSVAPQAAGFANAVMRRLSSIEIASDPVGEVPAWLARRLDAAWGEEEARSFWEASAAPPQTGLRLRPGSSPPEGAVPVEGIDGAYLWSGGEAPPGTVVQDPASVAVGSVVAPRPGDVALEVGAAPGGKTMHLLDQAPGLALVACDAHPRRARTGAGRVPGAAWVVADGARLPFPASTFDEVLVDAPCSGLGTLRRRPELLLRVSPAEVERLAALQRRLLEEALRVARTGGRVVYSVCTVTPEETVEVVKGLGFRQPQGPPGRPWGDGLLLGAHIGPTDGMFIAVRDRSSAPRS